MKLNLKMIAKRCQWEYERAVDRGDHDVARVLRYCLCGSTYNGSPDYKYTPTSNTIRALNATEGLR
ncbi:MAG TPA: hypothetical protein GX728_00870 [Clostridiaceae bacterium]|nr:hypothetical protein [Clostridiaceae bacterium]